MVVRRWLFGEVVYRAAVWARGEQGVFRHLREQRRLEGASPEQIRRRQRGRLAGALEHAWSTCELYRDRWPGPPPAEDGIRAYLEGLPLLSKEDVQERADALRSARAPGRFRTKTTGGSTGQAVTILKDADAIAREMAASWLGYGWYGIRRGDPAARFWGSPATVRRRLRFLAADVAMHRVRFSAFAFNDDDLDRYWRRCLRFRPTWFYGYVSMITSFANFLRRSGRDGRELGLRAVVTTSEVLSRPDRDLLQDTFGCPVQNEYGCGEVGPIAYECPHGSLHVMADNVVVEVLGESGRPVGIGASGEIVVTDLANRAMPLIRYRVGDYGVPGEPCSCGRPFPTLERIWGRAYDFVESPDGRRFHGEFFMYLFEELRTRGMGVDRFQVCQLESGPLEVRMVADTVLPVRREFLAQRLSKALPGIDVSFRLVDEIPRSPSGKMRLIVNEATERST